MNISRIMITGYPSMLAMLAVEQQLGRLHVRPRVMCTTSEWRTEEMTERIASTWQLHPHNCLGLTETGITAVDCDLHSGLHIFEDQCIIEAVDSDNRPVPMGVTGAKILVTSLYRRVQPIIRMEVTDLLSISDEPCPCGRPFRRIVSLEGRSDDVLEFPGVAGDVVEVHPIHLRSPLVAIREIVQYQISLEADGLQVAVVTAGDSASSDLVERTRHKLPEKLRELGVRDVPIGVQVVSEIARESGAGKLKLVRKSPVHAN